MLGCRVGARLGGATTVGLTNLSCRASLFLAALVAMAATVFMSTSASAATQASAEDRIAAPFATCDTRTICNAFGEPSRSTSLLDSDAPHAPTATYATWSSHVKATPSTTTTPERVEVLGAETLALHPDDVAAKAGPRTLDIGGGSFPGLTTKSIQRTPDGVISINPNAAHGPSVVGRSQQLPFADNSFSNVTMNHFPADQFAGGTLSEVARVLRPGGTLSITTGRRADVGAIVRELQGLGFSTRVGSAEGGIPWITGSL